nr:vWA domain-containing protein [Methyloferula stellata]
MFFLTALAIPQIKGTRNALDLLVVVDITGSMNTRDYTVKGEPVSRLDFVKTALRQMLANLPCQSHLALGIFSERRVFLLFDPVEVCANFAAPDGTMAALDWREAWDGDSHISVGLDRAIALAADLHTDLVFMTDGQEAPPLPPVSRPAFESKPGTIKGLIVGVGGYELSPIPKFDKQGRETGFYGEHDVLQESRFGLAPAGSENREGYNPRNAPFGAMKGGGSEHLSSVREAYLTELADNTGLSYSHLADESALRDALQKAATPHKTEVLLDRRPLFAAFGLICLVLVYAMMPLLSRMRVYFKKAKPGVR